MEKNIKANVNFFDRLSKRYDSFIIQSWMKRFYLPVFEEVKMGKRIIDVSCGTGEFLKNLDGELYGADISDGMLEIARKKIGKNAKIVKADVHKLPFSKNYFDYVISTESFHHYYNQKKAICEMARVCKKNGKVIVVDINFFFDLLHRIFGMIEPGCVKVNNREEIKHLFSEAGLKIIKQKRCFIFAVMSIGVKT